MNEYEGHWITTYPSNTKFHYLSPKHDEICIEDIAHALSLTCRFGGHCREFYSVAEHSIRVADEVDQDHKLSALLHDAHEAYLHDVPRPIKQDIRGYKEIADGIQVVIDTKFGLSYCYGIKYADDTLLATEARDLNVDTHGWFELPKPLKDVIYPWTSDDAEKAFLTYFELWRNGHD